MAKSRRKPARASTSNGSTSPSLSSTSAALPSAVDQGSSNRDSMDVDDPSTSTTAIPKIEEEADLPSKVSEGDDDSGGATGPDANDPPPTKSAAARPASRPRSRSTKGKGTTSAPVSSTSSTKPTSSTAASKAAAAKKDKPLKIEEADYEEREKRSLRATSSRTATRKVPVEEPEPLEDEDDADEDGGDSSEGVTRCFCEDDTDEMSSGLMIQCDTCKCWQHGSCVGLNNEKECPDRYFCELCRPNWHGPGGLLRKTHRKATPAASHHRSPSAAPRSNKPRESADAALVAAFLAAEQSVGGAAAGTSGESENERSPSAAPTAASAAKDKDGKDKKDPGDASVELKAPKKRSTMNSRDAAYDDAIAMSILGPGSAAMRARLEKARGDGDRSGSNGGDREDDSADDSSDRPRRSASRESHQDEGKMSTAESNNSHASKRRRISPDGAAVAIVTPEDAVVEANPPPPVPAAEVIKEPEPTNEMQVDPPVVQPEIIVELAPSPVPSPPTPTKEPEPTPAEEEEPPEPSKETSPAPLAAPRAKHPNQYTYRPKNGPTVTKATRASPVKRGAGNGASNGNGNIGHGNGHGHGHGHSTGGTTPNSAWERAGQRQRERDWAGVAELGPSGWGLPDHLRHLSHLLPSPLPLPLNVPVPVRLSSDSSSSSTGSSSATIDATHQEPATRVRFPNKRMTLPEMKKRAKTVLEYLTRIQIEMSDSNRRTEALLAAVSGGRTKQRGGTPVVPLVESMTMMDALTKDLILFQQKFET